MADPGSKAASSAPIDAEVIEAPPQRESVRNPLREMLDNRWLMLGLLFGATAGMGIPFLWLSRAFTTTQKTLLSVALLAYTAAILWLFWLVMAWCYGRIVGAF